MFRMIALVSFQSVLFMFAQLLLKVALKQFGDFNWNWGYFRGALLNPVFALAGICTLVGMFLWMYILKRYEFSIVYPLTSISFIFSLVAAPWILHESVPLTRWVGVGFILIGVFFVAK